MEIIGGICAVIALGVFIGLTAYEWLLWRERTKAEIRKLEAEAHFFDAVTAELEAYHE